MISALQHKSKYKSNSISNFFEKKNQIVWFSCCSTREDLSVDVSITYVGLILTKPGRFFSRQTETRCTDRIQFRQFRTFEKFSHFWVSNFHGVVLVKNIPLMHQLLMKDWYWRSNGDFSSLSKVKIRISNFFEKKIQIFGFPWVSYSWKPFHWCINY